jgi:DNA-binding NtrC family response regulator
MRRKTLPAVLVVHPDRIRLEQLRELLGTGYRVLVARSAELALELLSGLHVRCVLACEKLGERTGMDLLEEVHGRSPHTALVLLGDQPDLEAHPHVFGWLPEDADPAALTGMVHLAVQQALLDASARQLESHPERFAQA